MRTPDRTHLRQIAQGIVARAASDPSFRDQLHSEPLDTLVASGLPESAANECMPTDLGMDLDVVGYMQDNCLVTDCWITNIVH
jgi:hypothetical protein